MNALSPDPQMTATTARMHANGRGKPAPRFSPLEWLIVATAAPAGSATPCRSDIEPLLRKLFGSGVMAPGGRYHALGAMAAALQAHGVPVDRERTAFHRAGWSEGHLSLLIASIEQIEANQARSRDVPLDGHNRSRGARELSHADR